MAKFNAELPNDLIKQFNKLEQNAEKMMGEMTRAGAEIALSNAKASSPKSEIASHIKLSRTYKTPSDEGINTKVYVSGYIPFSDPNRKSFARKGGNGKMYYTTAGVPADFLVKLYEYGRSNRKFPKKPFFRKAFNKSQISSAMEKVQDKYLPKE